MKAQLDSKVWLYERFLEAKKKNARVSLRNFSRKLGVSASTVSDIFNGNRLVTEKLAMRFSDRLALGSEQREWLLRAVKVTKSKVHLPDDEEMIAATDSLFQKIDLAAFELLSHWYYLGILALGNVKGNLYSTSWISKRLGIDRAEARRALVILQRMGFLKREKKGFKQTGKPVSIETKGYEEAIRRFLKQHLEKAQTALDTVPAEEREVSSMTIAANPKNIEKARKMIKRFRRELSACLEEGEASRVYNISIQVFPLDQVESKS